MLLKKLREQYTKKSNIPLKEMFLDI